MVDEEFRIDTEKPVQDFLPLQGAPRHVAHRVHPVRLQPGGDAPADPPEVRQGPVRPVFAPIGHFVQFGDPYAVLVGRRVLGLDVHRHLRQIQVRGNARRRGDMGGVQHVLDHPPRQFMGGKAVQGQVIGRVDEDLVDGIDMDVLGGNVLEIDLVDFRAHLHVQGHPRDGDLEAQGQVRILLDGRVVGGFAGEPCPPGPGGIDLPDLLLYLEEPSPPGDAVGFERRGYGEADGLVRPGGVGHHEVRRQGIQAPLRAFHGGIERLEVDGDVSPFLIHRGLRGGVYSMSFLYLKRLGSTLPMRIFLFSSYSE